MTIVTEISEILKSQEHLSAVEAALIHLMSDYLTDQVAYCLESLDKELIASYCQDGWSIDRLEERQVTFFFGTVTFKRRRLRKAGEKSFLPLDEALGLEKRQRYSPLFKEKVGQLVTGMTYRQASKSLELLTNQSMSHQSLHTLAQSIAEKIHANQTPEESPLKCPKMLYIEADGVWVGSQEKHKHLEFKRGFIHEGVDRSGKRPCLIHPVYFGCFGTSKDLFNQMSDYLQSHYDLRQTIIIANSDGGSGYEADKFEEILGRYKSFHYCLDSYHVMRYVTGKLGFDKSLQTALRQAIKEYDKSTVETLLDTAESYLEAPEKLEKLLEVRAYLSRNWAAIKPLNLRGLGVSDGVGICESGHRFYTNRLKRQGRNWTKKGAENMATLLTVQRNGDFEALYRQAAPHHEFSPEISISASKFLKKVPHQEHTIPRANIPLNGVSSSPIGHLRKWI